jgi:hypothetical protein
MSEKGWAREHAVKTIIGTLITLAIGGIVTSVSPSAQAWVIEASHSVDMAFHWLGQPVIVVRWHFWPLHLSAPLSSQASLCWSLRI